jgi:hypothetical protein
VEEGGFLLVEIGNGGRGLDADRAGLFGAELTLAREFRELRQWRALLASVEGAES